MTREEYLKQLEESIRKEHGHNIDEEELQRQLKIRALQHASQQGDFSMRAKKSIRDAFGGD